MRILNICTNPLIPMRSGNAIRSMTLLKSISLNNEVDFVALGSDDSNGEIIKELKKLTDKNGKT